MNRRDVLRSVVHGAAGAGLAAASGKVAWAERRAAPPAKVRAPRAPYMDTVDGARLFLKEWERADPFSSFTAGPCTPISGNTR